MERPPTIGILEEFRLDFTECWERLPNKGLFFVLLAAWLALFQFLGNSTLGYINSPSLLKWMYLAYQPSVSAAVSDDGHGLLIPFLVVGLFWWKRKELMALPLRTWWPAILLVAFGLLLHLAGYAVQQPRVSIVGLFVGLFGLMGLAWGPQFLRHSLFPFFLFAFSVPLGSLAEAITFPLRLLVTRLVEVIAHFFLAIDVVRTGTGLTDPTGQYQYDVAAACSGIRSLVAIFMISTIYGFLTFRPMWKRLLMMAAAFPLAVLGNLARMLVIIIAADTGGQSAGNWAHENGFMSMIPYVPAILGLVFFGRLLGDASPPKPAAAQSGSRPPGNSAVSQPSSKASV